MLKNRLLQAAQSLDLGMPAGAIEILKSLPPEAAALGTRRLVGSLWSRALQMEAAEAGTLSDPRFRRGLVFVDACVAVADGANIWTLNNGLDSASENLGPERVADILMSVLWDLLPRTPYGFQYAALSRVGNGGNAQQLEALWLHLLRTDSSFVPDYWLFQGLAKSWSERAGTVIERLSTDLLRRAGRSDLDALFQIYLLLLRQRRTDRALGLARKLEDPTQRRRVSDYLLGASMTPDMLAVAADLHGHLVRDRTGDEPLAEIDFMEARSAVATGAWDTVLAKTERALSHPAIRDAAICLRALGHARTGDTMQARAATTFIRRSAGAPWFLKGRASMIDVTRLHVEGDLTLPEQAAAPSLHLGPGRPLAMALWVGPRLRWIEEMSIRSFLLNGWRYQLYVYDMPSNVPEGVEIMDADAVLSRKHLFREGAGSGMHKGSLGAFSDLFRYALLSRRGGLYTDTDVINLRSFEPDGMRFISTELNDGGIVGVNGAMMAAPADDPLQKQAFERALRIAESGDVVFTRIGPHLLAEILAESGMSGYRLMPPAFLNPIGWMETGRLLAPFEETSAEKNLSEAYNLHVYTETWRLIGLDLRNAPGTDTFFGRLHDSLMNERMSASEKVRDLVWKAAA